MDPIDPADLRISHSDREKVAEVLRDAAADGRIDLDELDERLEATWAAKTYRDLVPITLDLAGRGDLPAVPGASTPATPAPSPRPGAEVSRRVPAGMLPSHESSFAVMSETKRSGPWELGSVHTATAFMGSVVLDLREARFAGREVVINANAVMGSVEVLVDAWTIVHVEGSGVMGTFQEGRSRVDPDLGADSPVVRVRGVALMGSVEVKRRGQPGAVRRRLLGG
jgi:hypothetical protein